jgi:hypothetical protein
LRITQLRPRLELRLERSANPTATELASHVQMPQAADVRILNVWIGRHAADADQLVMHECAEEELAFIGQLDASADEIVDESPHESKAFRFAKCRELEQRIEIRGVEKPGIHR